MSSVPRSSNGSLSDAYLGDTPSVSSVLRKDANLVLLGTLSGIKRTGKKVIGQVHLLSRRSTKKSTVLYRNSRHHVALSRNDSAGLSDDSEAYCRSDNLGQSSGASLLL